MAMGRRRKTNRHLPARVYLRSGAYYFVDFAGKWHQIGRSLGEMYDALATFATPRAITTMADLLYRYRLEVLPTKAPGTQKNHARSLDRLTAVFGRMRPEDVRPKHIYAYRDKRSAAGKIAANHDLEVLKHAFVKAVEWGAVEASPAVTVRKFPKVKRERYVTDLELAAVRAVAHPMIRVALDLAVLTGLRRGDILALTRENLTDDGILVRTGKTGRTLLITWTDALRAVIAEAKALPPHVRQPIIATRHGKPMTACGFSTLWRRAMKAARDADADLAAFRFHDLRAKSASDTDDLAAAAARLGHSSPAVTDRHYRRAPSKVRPLR